MPRGCIRSVQFLLLDVSKLGYHFVCLASINFIFVFSVHRLRKLAQCAVLGRGGGADESLWKTFIGVVSDEK